MLKDLIFEKSIQLVAIAKRDRACNFSTITHTQKI